MAQQVELQIDRREITGKATKRLRKVGIIPANIFGHKEPSQAVQVDAVSFAWGQGYHRAALARQESSANGACSPCTA
jgi:large subunit ribosomal protein L25